MIRRGFLVLLVACGSTADLSLVTKDGGTAPPPLAPTLDFRDRDLRKGSMSGPLVVHPIAEESTDTAYEVMLEGSDAPLATLAANAGKDLRFEVIGATGTKRVGARTLRHGVRSDITWVTGDEYPRSHPTPSGQLTSYTFDDKGTLYAFSDDLMRCSGDTCDVITSSFPRPSGAAFDPVEKRLVGVWTAGGESSLGSQNTDGTSLRKTTFWKESMTHVAVDGSGHAYLDGPGKKCDLSTLECSAWTPMNAQRYEGVYADPLTDTFVTTAMSSSIVRCRLDGTDCISWPSYVGLLHTFSPSVHTLLVTTNYPMGALDDCDVRQGGCRRVHFAGGPWALTSLGVLDPERDVVWAIAVRSGATNPSLLRLKRDGSPTAEVELPVSSAPVGGALNSVNDTLYFFFQDVFFTVRAM